MKFDYMLRPWSLDDLNRCWEVYIEGTKVSEPTEDTDLLPGDDALLLGCYTLVKQYKAISISIAEVANPRRIKIPFTSMHQPRSRSREK